MDTTSLPPLGDETWAEQLSTSLQSHRDSVREFLAAQQARMERAEAILEEQIELLEKKSKEIELQESDKGLLPLPSHGSDQGVCHSWEAEKKRILAMLDGVLDGDEACQSDQRLKIEDVLRTTDQVIAEKDCDIEALLKQRLAKQIQEDTQEACEKVDLGKILDSDAVIQEERQRLLELQEQWRQKLRQAEIDISKERAQLARMRADLEAQARAAEYAATKSTSEANSTDNSDQPVHGRWLARLGLTDADRERTKRR
jgi:hypothetical protein